MNHRAALLSSRSLFVMEIENRACWRIRQVGQGVAELLRHAPSADLRGQSLASLLRCEDVVQLDSMWPTTDAHGLPFLSPNFLLHCICIRMFPSAFDLWTDVGTNEQPDELIDLFGDSSQYMPVMLRIIPLRGEGDERAEGRSTGKLSHDVERVLLVGNYGVPRAMGACRMCGMASCTRTQTAGPLQLGLRVQRPLPKPLQFEAIIGPEQRLQDQWTARIRNDFGWTCGLFGRIWHVGHDRQRLAAVFSSVSPELRRVLSEGCATVTEIIDAKKSMVSKAVLLQDFERSEGPVQPGARQDLCKVGHTHSHAHARTHRHTHDQEHRSVRLSSICLRFGGIVPRSFSQKQEYACAVPHAHSRSSPFPPPPLPPPLSPSPTPPPG